MPTVYSATGFTATSLIRRLLWSFWHYPLIIGGVYGPTETPLACRLGMLRHDDDGGELRVHVAPNQVGQSVDGRLAARVAQHLLPEIYPNLTTEGDSTMWYVDEFGLHFSAARCRSSFAVFFWSTTNTLVGERPAARFL